MARQDRKPKRFFAPFQREWPKKMLPRRDTISCAELGIFSWLAVRRGASDLVDLFDYLQRFDMFPPCHLTGCLSLPFPLCRIPDGWPCWAAIRLATGRWSSRLSRLVPPSNRPVTSRRPWSVQPNGSRANQKTYESGKKLLWLSVDTLPGMWP